MSKPSNPTTPEAQVLTAAIEAKQISKAKLADALDVTPGTVSQYASGNRPVPWDKAEPLAQRLGIAPASISSAYREIEKHFGGVAPRSQPARLDPEMLAESIEVLRQVYRNRRLKFDPAVQPDMVAYAYELLAELGDNRTTAQVADFGAKLAQRLAEKRGETGNGQNESKHAGGLNRKGIKGGAGAGKPT